MMQWLQCRLFDKHVYLSHDTKLRLFCCVHCGKMDPRIAMSQQAARIINTMTLTDAEYQISNRPPPLDINDVP